MKDTEASPQLGPFTLNHPAGTDSGLLDLFEKYLHAILYLGTSPLELSIYINGITEGCM